MDDIEFDEQVPILISQFRPRIPAQYWEGFEEKLDGGEYAMAIDTLLILIEDEGLPVSASEGDQLRAMLVYLGENTGVLDAISRNQDQGSVDNQ